MPDRLAYWKSASQTKASAAAAATKEGTARPAADVDETVGVVATAAGLKVPMADEDVKTVAGVLRRLAEE